MMRLVASSIVVTVVITTILLLSLARINTISAQPLPPTPTPPLSEKEAKVVRLLLGKNVTNIRAGLPKSSARPLLITATVTTALSGLIVAGAASAVAFTAARGISLFSLSSCSALSLQTGDEGILSSTTSSSLDQLLPSIGQLQFYSNNEPTFPASLLPTVGLGASKQSQQFYYRGAILGFCAFFVAAIVWAFYQHTKNKSKFRRKQQRLQMKIRRRKELMDEHRRLTELHAEWKYAHKRERDEVMAQTRALGTMTEEQLAEEEQQLIEDEPHAPYPPPPKIPPPQNPIIPPALPIPSVVKIVAVPFLGFWATASGSVATSDDHADLILSLVPILVLCVLTIWTFTTLSTALGNMKKHQTAAESRADGNNSNSNNPNNNNNNRDNESADQELMTMIRLIPSAVIPNEVQDEVIAKQKKIKAKQISKFSKKKPLFRTKGNSKSNDDHTNKTSIEQFLLPPVRKQHSDKSEHTRFPRRQHHEVDDDENEAEDDEEIFDDDDDEVNEHENNEAPPLLRTNHGSNDDEDDEDDSESARIPITYENEEFSDEEESQNDQQSHQGQHVLQKHAQQRETRASSSNDPFTPTQRACLAFMSPRGRWWFVGDFVWDAPILWDAPARSIQNRSTLKAMQILLEGTNGPWQDINVKTFQRGPIHATMLNRVASLHFFLAFLITLASCFMAGYSHASDNQFPTCKNAKIINSVLGIASFVIQLTVKPNFIPSRHFAVLLAEFLVALASLIALAGTLDLQIDENRSDTMYTSVALVEALSLSAAIVGPSIVSFVWLIGWWKMRSAKIAVVSRFTAKVQMMKAEKRERGELVDDDDDDDDDDESQQEASFDRDDCAVAAAAAASASIRERRGDGDDDHSEGDQAYRDHFGQRAAGPATVQSLGDQIAALFDPNRLIRGRDATRPDWSNFEEQLEDVLLSTRHANNISVAEELRKQRREQSGVKAEPLAFNYISEMLDASLKIPASPRAKNNNKVPSNRKSNKSDNNDDAENYKGASPIQQPRTRSLLALEQSQSQSQQQRQQQQGKASERKIYFFDFDDDDKKHVAVHYSPPQLLTRQRHQEHQDRRNRLLLLGEEENEGDVTNDDGKDEQEQSQRQERQPSHHTRLEVDDENQVREHGADTKQSIGDNVDDVDVDVQGEDDVDTDVGDIIRRRREAKQKWKRIQTALRIDKGTNFFVDSNDDEVLRLAHEEKQLRAKHRLLLLGGTCASFSQPVLDSPSLFGDAAASVNVATITSDNDSNTFGNNSNNVPDASIIVTNAATALPSPYPRKQGPFGLTREQEREMSGIYHPDSALRFHDDENDDDDDEDEEVKQEYFGKEDDEEEDEKDKKTGQMQEITREGETSEGDEQRAEQNQVVDPFVRNVIDSHHKVHSWIRESVKKKPGEHKKRILEERLQAEIEANAVSLGEVGGDKLLPPSSPKRSTIDIWFKTMADEEEAERRRIQQEIDESGIAPLSQLDQALGKRDRTKFPREKTGNDNKNKNFRNNKSKVEHDEALSQHEKEARLRELLTYEQMERIVSPRKRELMARFPDEQQLQQQRKNQNPPLALVVSATIEAVIAQDHQLIEQLVMSPQKQSDKKSRTKPTRLPNDKVDEATHKEHKEATSTTEQDFRPGLSDPAPPCEEILKRPLLPARDERIKLTRQRTLQQQQQEQEQEEQEDEQEQRDEKKEQTPPRPVPPSTPNNNSNNSNNNDDNDNNQTEVRTGSTNSVASLDRIKRLQVLRQQRQQQQQQQQEQQ